MSRDPNPFRFEEVDATTQRVPSSPIQPWAAFVVSLLSMIACGIVNTIVSLPIAVAATALFKEQLGFGQLGMLLLVFVPTGCIVGALSICLMLRNIRGLMLFGLTAFAVPFVFSFRAVTCSLWSLVLASVIVVTIDLAISVVVWKIAMRIKRDQVTHSNTFE